MRMTIHVTPEDIAAGVAGDCRKCPVTCNHPGWLYRVSLNTNGTTVSPTAKSSRLASGQRFSMNTLDSGARLTTAREVGQTEGGEFHQLCVARPSIPLSIPLQNQPTSTMNTDTIPAQPVLDAACGSRMFWFDKADPRAVYVDKRREEHSLTDASSRGGRRTLVVDPDLKADFTSLPFPDGRFALVVFDPPHLVHAGKNSWLAKKYGKLQGDWRNELRLGFSECFRVLKLDGVLIFKWNENDVPVSQILSLCSVKPLFGNRCGRQSRSHWITFIKT